MVVRRTKEKPWNSSKSQSRTGFLPLVPLSRRTYAASGPAPFRQPHDPRFVPRSPDKLEQIVRSNRSRPIIPQGMKIQWVEREHSLVEHHLHAAIAVVDQRERRHRTGWHCQHVQ
jgi:hypothetical protein